MESETSHKTVFKMLIWEQIINRKPKNQHKCEAKTIRNTSEGFLKDKL